MLVLASYMHKHKVCKSPKMDEDAEPPTKSHAWVQLRYHPRWAKVLSRAVSRVYVPGYKLRIAWKNLPGAILSRVSKLNLDRIRSLVK